MNEIVILSLNSGSSSLKYGLFRASGPGAEPNPLFSGAVEGIASPPGRFWVRDAAGQVVREDCDSFKDQASALHAVAQIFGDSRFPAPNAIGHRIVHGGPNLLEHRRITPAVLKQLEAASVFAPLHVPVELRLIRLAEKHFPGVPQFACFDTGFHRTLPESAARFALPEKFWAAGVRRYGFHGLSCESILHTLGDAVPPRMILAHLGSGSSITAIAHGRSVDTSMGLTPTGGIVMATRTGDLDPGIFPHVMRTAHLGPDELETLLDRESGLLALSGFTGDMRELQQASSNPRARLAIEIFSRSARKVIGSFIAILGGLDLLVFTGGIGEHDAPARAQICDGLEALGVALDTSANSENRAVISKSESQGQVRVIQTNEDAQIARHTARLFQS